jgi:AcrR family transcriptional regulator
MNAHEPARISSKGERTREHILDTALQLFVELGYESTTMRAIAAAAETSLGLTYRYFASKEDLVLALYQRITEQMLSETGDLERGSIAQRFEATMRRKIALLTPYRAALSALFATALVPSSQVAVLGESSAEYRRVGFSIFYAVVAGANDAPRPSQARQLATLLYASYLLMVLFWLNDRSEGGRATTELIGLTRSAINLARPTLILPPMARLLARLAKTIGPVFGTLDEPLPS